MGLDPSLNKEQKKAATNVVDDKCWLEDSNENNMNIFGELENAYDMNFEGSGGGV